MAAEAEHGEGDEGLGRFESEGDADDEFDFGIHRYLEPVDGFDASVGEFVFDGGEDRGAVFDDAALEFHERGDPGSARPGDPFVECFAGVGVGQFEDDPESFLSVNRPSRGNTPRFHWFLVEDLSSGTVELATRAGDPEQASP